MASLSISTTALLMRGTWDKKACSFARRVTAELSDWSEVTKVRLVN